jgi:excisionase family DNA binding protein
MSDLERIFAPDVAAVLEAEIDRLVQAALAERVGDPARRYLTVPEAAECLRAKPQRVYDLLSDGRLTRHRDGARVLVSRDELDRYLDSDKGRA